MHRGALTDLSGAWLERSTKRLYLDTGLWQNSLQFSDFPVSIHGISGCSVYKGARPLRAMSEWLSKRARRFGERLRGSTRAVPQEDGGTGLESELASKASALERVAAVARSVVRDAPGHKRALHQVRTGGPMQ